MVQNFGRFGKSGKKVVPRKELLFLNSPRNYRVFHTNGKRSLYLIKHRILIKGVLSDIMSLHVMYNRGLKSEHVTDFSGRDRLLSS